MLQLDSTDILIWLVALGLQQNIKGTYFYLHVMWPTFEWPPSALKPPHVVVHQQR